MQYTLSSCWWTGEGGLTEWDQIWRVVKVRRRKVKKHRLTGQCWYLINGNLIYLEALITKKSRSFDFRTIHSGLQPSLMTFMIMSSCPQVRGHLAGSQVLPKCST